MAVVSTCNWASNDKSVKKKFKKKYIYTGKKGIFLLWRQRRKGKEESWIEGNIFLVDLTGCCLRLTGLSTAKKGKTSWQQGFSGCRYYSVLIFCSLNKFCEVLERGERLFVCTNVNVLGSDEQLFIPGLGAVFDCSALQKLKAATEGHQLQGKTMSRKTKASKK